MIFGDDLVTVSEINRISLYKSADEPVSRIPRPVLQARKLRILFNREVSILSVLAMLDDFIARFLHTPEELNPIAQLAWDR